MVIEQSGLSKGNLLLPILSSFFLVFYYLVLHWEVATSLPASTTVYPKKYAHGFSFAVLCCGYTLTDFPISIRLTSLALWQSNDCPSASKATLMNMDKYFMWIHYERLHNHNKAKHNKAVCIFLGIYGRSSERWTLLALGQTGWHFADFISNAFSRIPMLNHRKKNVYWTAFSKSKLAQAMIQQVGGVCFNTLRLKKNGSHFADIFKFLSFYGNCSIFFYFNQ